MNRILENEINRLIGRFPTDAELKSALEYIDYWSDDQTTADKLKSMLGDWCEEHMRKCDHCGKWHLIDEMLEVYGTYYCDEVCKYDHDQYTYDMSQLEADEYRFNVLNA